MSEDSGFIDSFKKGFGENFCPSCFGENIQNLNLKHDAIFWCMVCKNFEESLKTDLLNIEIATDNYLYMKEKIEENAGTAIETNSTILFNNLKNIRNQVQMVPNFFNAIQNNAGSQSIFNLAWNNATKLASNITKEQLGKAALTIMDTMGFPTEFALGGMLGECIGEMILSYGNNELEIGLDISKLFNFLNTINPLIQSYIPNLQAYLEIGCNPETGLSLEGEFEELKNLLPYDENGNLDKTGFISNLGASTGITENLQMVSNEFASFGENFKEFFG